MKRIGVYIRVSTEDQKVDLQKNDIDDWISRHVDVDNAQIKYFIDQGVSGKHVNRPQYQNMMDQVERGRLDSVLVWKLDRLSRDAVTSIRLILRFDELNVEFVAVTQQMFSHGQPFRHAIIAIFAELAQMERELIAERVKAGLAAAKKRGVKLGAPIKIDENAVAKIWELRDSGASIRAISKQTKLSVGSVHKAIKMREKLELCSFSERDEDFEITEKKGRKQN